MDAQMARRRGHRGLASWLDVAESLWHEHSSQSMRFIEQIDYYGKLSSQFPQSRYRIIYTKAGTIPAAHLLRTADAIVDHKLYWASVDHKEEAYYLVAFLNSETLRASAQHLQSRGQWGARDFDKVFFSLPIPKFSFNNDLHIRLSEAAVEAERISNLVDLEAVTRFVDARRRIRTALAEDGIAGEIDDLVRQLLFGE
jgi:hypothetical protein